MDTIQTIKRARYTMGGESDKRPHSGLLHSQPRKMMKTTTTTSTVIDNDTLNKRYTLPPHAVPPYSQQHQSSQSSQNQWSSQSSTRRLTANQRYPNKSLASNALDIFNSGGVLPQTIQKKPKTPKDIRSPEAQRHAVRTVIDYLVTHQYGPISPRELRGMSARVFESVFKFLYLVYDPDYTFHPKFKDEFFLLAREIKYPYVDSINPKSLDSIAAPHSLPRYLALLSYMAELCQSIERRRARKQINDQDSMIDTNKGITPRQMDRIFWDYATAKYHAFMQDSDGKDADEELKQLFDAINKGNMGHHNELLAELRQVEQDARRIEQRVALYEQRQQEKRNVEEKVEKCATAIDAHKRKLAKLKNAVEENDAELKRLNEMMNECIASRDRLRAGMKNPEISDEEFQRMMELQTKLDMSVENQRITLNELQQEQWMKEMDKEKKRVEIERTTLEYNNMIKTMANITVDDNPHLNEPLVFNPDNPTEMITPQLDEKDWHVLESQVNQIKASVAKLEQLEIQRQSDYQRLQQKIREDRQELVYLEEDYQKKSEQWKAASHEAAEESRHFAETKEQLGQAEDKLRRDAVVERIDAQTRQRNAQLRLDSTRMHVEEQKKHLTQKLAKIESYLAETDDSITTRINDLTQELASLFPPVPHS